MHHVCLNKTHYPHCSSNPSIKAEKCTGSQVIYIEWLIKPPQPHLFEFNSENQQKNSNTVDVSFSIFLFLIFGALLF